MSAVQDRKGTYGVSDIKASCDTSETVLYRTSSDKWRYKNKHMIISLKSEEEENEPTSWALRITNLIIYSPIKMCFSNVISISVNLLLDVQTVQ
jgi:hypothetical protein